MGDLKFILYDKIRDCPFCNPEADRERIAESDSVYSIYDKFPVSNGHALIIPKNHCCDFFDLNFEQQSSCLLLLNKVKQIINEKYKPDGFNIGVNVGSSAGQTVNHVHIHLIPRYNGDVKNPEGGIRNVIPSKAKYLK